MNEPKAFASLSSGLLARKGAAKPAMRPQGFGQIGASLEDLGWNDMGFEPPKPTVAAHRDEDHDGFGEAVGEQPIRNPIAALTPSPVHGQQAELAEHFRDEDEDEDEIDERDEIESHVPTLVVEPEPEAEIVAEPEANPQPVLRIKPVAIAPVVALAPRPVEERAPKPRAERGSGPKSAFTLRLDSARHLRLRLACVMTGQSAQRLVSEALDAHLKTFPELENFAGQLPEGSRSRRAKG